VRGVSRHGTRLRRRGDVGRLHRVHAGDHRQCDGQHGRPGAAVQAVAESVSGGADGRRVLHRLHQRAHHHGVSQLFQMTMTTDQPLTRAKAWELLTEYTKGESLLKHALAVEAAVRGYARKFGEDEELWGITALLHDFDYERYPDLSDHPFRGSEI